MSRILKASHDEHNAVGFNVYHEFHTSISTAGGQGPEMHLDSYLDEALKQSEIIIDTARNEAGKIRQAAQEKGKQQGFEEGYQAGVDKAYEEHSSTLNTKVKLLEERIAGYVDDMQIEKEKVLEQYMDDLKGIALAVGEKIVQASLKSSADVVERMIISATEKLKKTAWAKIYVGKGQAAYKVHGDSRLLQELSKLSDNVKIILMDEEEPGTCIIELPDEIIDISVGTQLENIKDILNNARV